MNSTRVGLALATVVAIGMFAAEAQVADVSGPKTDATIAVKSGQSRAVPAMAPDKAARTPPGKTTIRSTRVELKTGDTLLTILTDTGIPYAEAFAATEAMASVFDARSLKAGQQMDLRLQCEDTANERIELTFVRKDKQEFWLVSRKKRTTIYGIGKMSDGGGVLEK